ncbi:hypothetical protein N7534_008521 [Penicillium rubens]|nr:hypothetical protein N7534_008521 [Penicillium rubens]
MLQLSSKPFRNLDVLLGISAVLLELQGVIVEAPNVGLSFSSAKPYHCLQGRHQYIFADERLRIDDSYGYAMAKIETANCVKVQK